MQHTLTHIHINKNKSLSLPIPTLMCMSVRLTKKTGTLFWGVVVVWICTTASELHFSLPLVLVKEWRQVEYLLWRDWPKTNGLSKQRFTAQSEERTSKPYESRERDPQGNHQFDNKVWRNVCTTLRFVWKGERKLGMRYAKTSEVLTYSPWKWQLKLKFSWTVCLSLHGEVEHCKWINIGCILWGWVCVN